MNPLHFCGTVSGGDSDELCYFAALLLVAYTGAPEFPLTRRLSSAAATGAGSEETGVRSICHPSSDACLLCDSDVFDVLSVNSKRASSICVEELAWNKPW